MASFSYRYGFCACARAICSIECNTYAKYGPKPKTNADQIRAMTDEELAGFILKVGGNVRAGLTPDGGWLEWLKQEADT